MYEFIAQTGHLTWPLTLACDLLQCHNMTFHQHGPNLGASGNCLEWYGRVKKWIATIWWTNMHKHAAIRTPWRSDGWPKIASTITINFHTKFNLILRRLNRFISILHIFISIPFKANPKYMGLYLSIVGSQKLICRVWFCPTFLPRPTPASRLEMKWCTITSEIDILHLAWKDVILPPFFSLKEALFTKRPCELDLIMIYCTHTAQKTMPNSLRSITNSLIDF